MDIEQPSHPDSSHPASPRHPNRMTDSSNTQLFAPGSPASSVAPSQFNSPHEPQVSHPTSLSPPRLAIHTLVLHNFKSYGGTVQVGPFHKNFSAIVGPNGSGKSNVIDAMLFIFGRPAKQLRHAKLSELLHNSATHGNVQSATVTVYFHDIVDTGPGDEDFTALPNSEFSVSRTAYLNNTSKYFLNDVEVKRKEIVELLKSKGVDLDNNRFLILQGEVEQIAMMKPKSVNAHDTGLLEYLEDIIGSNRHIEKIEQSANAIESLNEARSHKLQRVKAAERERDALENAKNEAQDFLDKERHMLNSKLKLNFGKRNDARVSLAERTDELKIAEEKVGNFKTDVEEKQKAVTELEKKFKDTQKHEAAAVKDLNEAKESYSAFERKDIKLREDMKALKAKDKKLNDAIRSETKRTEDHEAKHEQYLEEKTVAEKLLLEAEVALDESQSNFDEIRDEVKVRTQPIRERVEKKQAELLPFSEAVNTARKDVQVIEANLKLLDERLTAPQKNYDEAVSALESVSALLRGAFKSLRAQQSEYENEKQNLSHVDREILEKQRRIDDLSASLSSIRRKLEEARSARDFSKTRSKLHRAILSASRAGRLQGIVGRLGDLASVEEKFATAVSAGAGSTLDCIVVRTAQHAQACIQFLRTENLGRATFVILEKIEYLREPMDRWSRSDRCQDGQRLFDHLTIPNPQNRTALYFSLRDTLICQTLEEARRVAYKPTRKNRVVTLAGELIESSGSITGGGRVPTKYRLGSGQGSEGAIDDETFQALGSDVEKMRDEVLVEREALEANEAKKQAIHRRVEDLELLISKAKAEISSIESRESNLKSDTLPNLKKALEKTKSGIRNKTSEDYLKKMEAEDDLSRSKSKLEKAKAACEDLESAISMLQDEILAAGGSQLEEVKAELDLRRKTVSSLKTDVSTASSRATTAGKAAKKAQAAVKAAEEERKRIMDDLENARQQSEALLDDAEMVEKRIKEAEKVHEEWSEKLNEAQAEYADTKGALKSLRRKEVSLVEAADALKRIVNQENHYLLSLEKENESIRKKIRKLTMLDLPHQNEDEEVEGVAPSGATIDEDKNGDDGDDMQCEERNLGEEERNLSPTQDADSSGAEIALTAEDKKRLEVEIARLESELASMTPNLNAIGEYASKEKEYMSQVGELDDVTSQRDEARRECDRLKKARLDEFMSGFSIITLKLKELYQMITLGGDAELELVDSLDPFSEGVVFSVRPPKKSWKNICNLSGGEKTLSSLALVFALHHFKPTPLYFLDEIDAALDFKNVSIVGNYVKERTKDAQFIIISLRNNMFELADRLVGIYKTHHTTKSVTINPRAFVMPTVVATQVTYTSSA